MTPNLRPLAGRALLIEQGLDGVKGVLVNQRLVSSVEHLFIRRAALIDDLADVVAVAQHVLEHGGSELGGWPAGAGARTNTESV